MKQFKIFLKYLFLLLIALPNLNLFYLVFTPLTIYPLYFLLDLFFNPVLIQNTIILNNIAIEIIKPCIAGAAYYLLLILNLSIPQTSIKNTLTRLAFAFSSLLLLNIARILILILIFIKVPPLFDITHKVFWYSVSILFVVLIWFAEVKLFKIKSIPFYTDIKSFKLKKK